MRSSRPLSPPLPRLVVGERVRLELWRPDALAEVTTLIARSRGSLSAYLPWAFEGLSAEEEAAVQALATERWRAGIEANWLVLESGSITGMLGLHRRGGPDELEIGYWLDDAATGRGLITAASTMAVDVAFSYREIGSVEIRHDAANRRSEAVPRRLGFSRTSACTATPEARCETGIKVTWSVTRTAWRRTHPTSSVLSAE